MILRTYISATLVFVMALFAVPAFAETAEHGEAPAEHGEPAAEAEEQSGSHGPVGLPWEAINWADFGYQSEEAEARYAEHGVHEAGPPMIAVIFNFALLLVLLYFIARKPLAEFLQARSDAVREGLSQAKELLEEANERLADYSSRLERMDDEMSKLREEFIAAGEAERDRLVADATLKSDRMRRDAETRLQQEFAQLREEIRSEAIDKAVSAATDALNTQVKEADHRRLADEYVEQIEREGTGQ